MEAFTSTEKYLAALEARAALPTGFRVSTVSLTFRPVERDVAQPLAMNLSLILLDRETPEFAAVYTANRFPGVPVLLGRERLARDGIRGVLVNNRIANVCAPSGRGDAERLLAALGRETGSPADAFLPASTGIIGWRLPVAEMEAALPGLVRGARGGSFAPVAHAIMTTDRFPKLRSRTVGFGRIVGIAKGAGMIEPRLGTMLCFLCTDVGVGREELRTALAWAADRTLNRISIDGDQSTSDMAMLLSSRAKGPADPEAFREALRQVLAELAEDIVRNGEGTSHVIRVTVSGAPDDEAAAGAGKAVVNSPLVKTAVCGNDPNVGRLASAIGDWAGGAAPWFDAASVTVRLGGVEVLAGGAFRLDTAKEERLSAYLRGAAFDPAARGFPAHDRCVDIEVSLNGGPGTAVVLGSDLSAEYVRENADYRS
ncbi:MAG: bifunctional ornithine acetyltransferase/N-acetylglutamate synthase [Spirochaetes bacterium]|nr:bifunctional ornithine acetyltransferase/N-acetylglutamate synthase [Spirochaetota bacterium]